VVIHELSQGKGVPEGIEAVPDSSGALSGKINKGTPDAALIYVYDFRLQQNGFLFRGKLDGQAYDFAWLKTFLVGDLNKQTIEAQIGDIKHLLQVPEKGGTAKFQAWVPPSLVTHFYMLTPNINHDRRNSSRKTNP
jgi:hypothetical protein